MGRAADNERKKLRATFFNNLSIGLILGGVLIPYITATAKLPLIAERIDQGEWFTRVEVWTTISFVVGMVLAYWGGIKLRKHADQIAGQIEGD